MISTLRAPSQWLLDLVMGGGKAYVNSSNMNSIPAVWYALQKISGDIGKMPLEPKRTMRDGRGSETAYNHPSYSLLRDAPNEYQTSDVFKELIQLHALSYGNGRAYIRRENGRPVELIPMLPDRTDTVMVQGQKFHCTQPDLDDPILFRDVVEETVRTGKIPNSMLVFHDRDVLHILGLNFDGFCGWSIGRVFQDVLGAARSNQKFVKKQSEKGFTGKVMLKDVQGAFSGQNAEKQATDFLNDFRERFSSEGDAEVVGMLRRGMEAEVLTMSNADAQLLEQMRFSRQDVALIFGLSYIPGDGSNTAYSTLEQKKLDTLETTNDRWMTRWENQCDMKLRTTQEKASRNIYHKFNAGSRLRTDIQTTSTTLSTLVRATIMTRNEAREKLEMNPVDGGDEFVNPAIQVQQVDETRSDQARNKLRELASVEAKRIVEIVNKKSLSDADAAIRSFYEKFKVTLNRAMCELDESFDSDWHIDNRMEEIGDIAGSSKNVSEFRKLISQAVLKWSQPDES